MSKGLFIPLRTEYFRQFESGEKFHEWRLYGARWNESTCKIGRPVTLSHGYSGTRLKARVASFSVFVAVPPEARDAITACYGTALEGYKFARIGVDLLCDDCEHPRIHHFSDAQGHVRCRSTKSCKCVRSPNDG